MRTSLTLALAALAVPAFAQNSTFVTELLQTLESLNLTSLANASEAVANTSTGQSLLEALSEGTMTVFAPNNDAFVGIHPNISSDLNLLADVLSYHVVPGTFNITPTYPNTTVGRTSLNASSDLVFLEGNKNQVLAWSSIDNTTHILNQNTDVVVTNTTSVGNLTLHIVSAVIDTPGPFADALVANNLTSFQAALQAANLFDTLNYVHGVTIFAPTNDAISAVQSQLSSVESNTTLLETVLLNHVINGSSIYSGNLIGLGSGSNLTTAAGEGIGASFNTSGSYVTGGNTTAKITTPDLLLWNGVMHIIDAVLVDTQSDSSAASSAASSASVAATFSVTESGPIGFTQTASSGESSSSSSSSSAAMASANLVSFSSFALAGAVSVIGALLGGFMTL